MDKRWAFEAPRLALELIKVAMHSQGVQGTSKFGRIDLVILSHDLHLSAR